MNRAVFGSSHNHYYRATNAAGYFLHARERKLNRDGLIMKPQDGFLTGAANRKNSPPFIDW
jgi:hypothetical protein